MIFNRSIFNLSVFILIKINPVLVGVEIVKKKIYLKKKKGGKYSYLMCEYFFFWIIKIVLPEVFIVINIQF